MPPAAALAPAEDAYGADGWGWGDEPSPAPAAPPPAGAEEDLGTVGVFFGGGEEETPAVEAVTAGLAHLQMNGEAGSARTGGSGEAGDAPSAIRHGGRGTKELGHVCRLWRQLSLTVGVGDVSWFNVSQGKTCLRLDSGQLTADWNVNTRT